MGHTRIGLERLRRRFPKVGKLAVATFWKLPGPLQTLAALGLETQLL